MAVAAVVVAVSGAQGDVAAAAGVAAAGGGDRSTSSILRKGKRKTLSKFIRTSVEAVQKDETAGG